MICKKCNSQIPDSAVFCSNCGTRIESQSQESTQEVCSFCGKPFPLDDSYCKYCGSPKRVPQATYQTFIDRADKRKNDLKDISVTPNKASRSYVINVISTFITLIIRLSIQGTIRLSSLLENKYYIGIDPDIKPLITGIPVLTAVIVAVMLLKDKNMPKEKRNTTLIINAVIIVVSLFFIWFDIPRELFDW